MVSSDDVQTNNVLENTDEVSNNNEDDASQNSADSTENSENDVSPNNIESSNSDTVTISQNENIVSTDNEDKKSHLSVANTTVVNGKKLYFYLKNSAGKGISGQKVTITFANKKYTKTTDSNGQFSLNINSKVGQYTVTITYDGNNNYLASSALFKIKVYKEKTILTVASTSIAREKYLYIYLKNSAGNAISGQKVTITFANKKYTKTTNSNGRVSLKMNYKAKYYSVKVKYSGTTSYLASSKTFKVKVYKQKTKISVSSTSILRGTYMTVLLQDENNNAISSKLVTITFNKKHFQKYTNKKGEATLKIISKAGTYPVKIRYAGSASYLSCSKTFTAKSYAYKTKIEVNNPQIIKGNYLNIYLKNSDNKAVSNQKLEIKFNNKKYSKTTNSNGGVSLKIDANVNNYTTTIKYAGSTSYLSASKTLTISVITNTAKIIATNQVSNGNYSVRLVDSNGIPISNKIITLYAYNGTQSIGSGINITTKTIILDSDNIYNKTADLKLLNDIRDILISKGYNVTVNSNIGPNAHCNDIMGNYSDACVFCIFGGVDSGMFVDMASNWYQYYLNKYNNQVVLGFTRTLRNLATETFLERAHDDNYSPNNFTGLANPGTYLNEKGFDYVYGNTASQIAENFINYAVNGLSIGKDNILPGVLKTYTATTDENGYASISGLSEGHYKIISSCSSATEYTIDSVTSYLTVT